MAKLPNVNNLSASEEATLDDLKLSFNQLVQDLAVAMENRLTFAENVDCEIVSAKFTHGVSQLVKLKRMPFANSAISLGGDAQTVLGVNVTGTSAGQAKITVSFADTTATNVLCNILLLKEGAGLRVPTTFTTPAVTSVALAAPVEFTVSGSPVTSAGTLTLTKASQSANLLYSGPSSGAAAAPTFRAQVAADVPALDASKITTGVLPIAVGGTNNGALAVTAGGGLYTDGSKIVNGGAGTSGQVWTSNGTTASFQNAAGVGTAGWNRVVSLDLSAQSNQTLGTDTTFTVGGYTWTKTGSANDSVAMAIVNGQGLVIQPKSTGDYSAGTRTIPMLWLPFSQMGIGANLSWFTGVRLLARVSAFNGAANFDNAAIGIDGGSMVFSWALFRGKNTGDQFTGRRTLSSASSSATAAITVGAANDVMVVEAYNLGGDRFTTQSGSYSGGFPAINTLKFQTAQGDASGIGAFQTISSTGQPGDMGVWLGALRAGSGTVLSVTFSHIAVDVHI